MSHIDEATQWDDCPYAKFNANTFVRAYSYRVFLTLCVWINLRGTPWGLRHLWGALYELASPKYCYDKFSR